MYQVIEFSREAKELKVLIEKNLSKDFIRFSDLSDLSQNAGVYFIYDYENLVYIGEGQNIKTRCMQYLQKGSGRTFRDKLESDKQLSTEEAIVYIRGNCQVKFIEEVLHKKLEHLSIGLFNTKYND